MAIKCSTWNKLKALQNCSGDQIANLAKLLIHLFLEKGLPITTLKVFFKKNLTFSEQLEKSAVFSGRAIQRIRQGLSEVHATNSLGHSASRRFGGLYGRFWKSRALRKAENVPREPEAVRTPLPAEKSEGRRRGRGQEEFAGTEGTNGGKAFE